MKELSLEFLLNVNGIYRVLSIPEREVLESAYGFDLIREIGEKTEPDYHRDLGALLLKAKKKESRRAEMDVCFPLKANAADDKKRKFGLLDVEEKKDAEAQGVPEFRSLPTTLFGFELKGVAETQDQRSTPVNLPQPEEEFDHHGRRKIVFYDFFKKN